MRIAKPPGNWGNKYWKRRSHRREREFCMWTSLRSLDKLEWCMHRADSKKYRGKQQLVGWKCYAKIWIAAYHMWEQELTFKSLQCEGLWFRNNYYSLGLSILPKAKTKLKLTNSTSSRYTVCNLGNQKLALSEKDSRIQIFTISNPQFTVCNQNLLHIWK